MRHTSDRPLYCPKCNGIGLLDWKTPDHYPISELKFCDCKVGQRKLESVRVEVGRAQQKRLDAAFASAGIPPHFRGLTIETMIERCENDRGKDEAIKAVKSLMDQGYIEDSGSKRYKSGVILSGDFGRGKTGLLTPVLCHMLKGGKVGLWIEMYGFLSAIQSGYANNSSLSRLESAQRADVILLDDFGDKDRTQPETEDRRRIIYELVNYRHNYSLPMLITTNLNGVELSQQFGKRITERILEACAWVKVGGENLRFAPTAKARPTP